MTDKLTAYNGQAITYDAIGNPLSYRDGIAMTWKNGRQLDTFTDGTNNVSYSYDSNSVRVSKTVDGVKYTYEYLNGKLLFETRGEAKFWYSYDSNGILYNIRYTLSDDSAMLSYYCTHNSRGDIIGIYNGNGVLRAQYKYDSWGNVLSVTDENGNAITSATHVGNLNPFRYRGYYYDTESGFYYLMSRYYDPVTHRFINADGYFQPGNSILAANTFAYCENNPIMYFDPSGTATLYQLQYNLAHYDTCNYDIDLITTYQKQGYGLYDEIGFIKLDANQIVFIIGDNTLSSGFDYLNDLCDYNSPYFLREFVSSASKVNQILFIHQISYEVATDLTSGNNWDKIAYDVSADVLCTAGPVVITTIIGTCVGGPLGAGIGFVVGSAITILVDGVSYYGKTGRQHLKSLY